MCLSLIHVSCAGAPLIIHPGRDQQSPSHILDVLEAAGADLSRTVMSHIDRTVFSDDALLQLAKRGCYLEYDLFGIECSHYQVKYIHCIYVTQKEARQINALVQSEKKKQSCLGRDLNSHKFYILWCSASNCSWVD